MKAAQCSNPSFLPACAGRGSSLNCCGRAAFLRKASTPRHAAPFLPAAAGFLEDLELVDLSRCSRGLRAAVAAAQEWDRMDLLRLAALYDGKDYWALLSAAAAHTKAWPTGCCSVQRYELGGRTVFVIAVDTEQNGFFSAVKHAGGSDIMGTGSKVWPMALDLCRFLAHNPALVRGKRCFELGSGAGLVACFAASLPAGEGPAQFTASEVRPSLLKMISVNAMLNGVHQVSGAAGAVQQVRCSRCGAAVSANAMLSGVPRVRSPLV